MAHDLPARIHDVALVFSSLLLVAACAGSDRDLGSTEGKLRTKTDVTENPDAPRPSASTPSPGALGPSPVPMTISTSPVPTMSAPVASSPSTTATCSDGTSFEAATASEFREQTLYGTWVDEEVAVTDLGLPSGSKRIVLTVAEDDVRLILGSESDPPPLLDGSVLPGPGAREGFAYTLRVEQILENEYPHPIAGVYPWAAISSVAPAEPFAELCAAEEPVAWSATGCAYTCLPEELSDWSEIEETDESGVCLVDGSSELSCDDARLCAGGCFCDEASCHHDPFARLEVVAALAEDGTLELFLPKEWTEANLAPTLGADGVVVAELERQGSGASVP